MPACGCGAAGPEQEDEEAGVEAATPKETAAAVKQSGPAEKMQTEEAGDLGSETGDCRSKPGAREKQVV